jgi:hypothetical protein
VINIFDFSFLYPMGASYHGRTSFGTFFEIDRPSSQAKRMRAAKFQKTRILDSIHGAIVFTVILEVVQPHFS